MKTVTCSLLLGIVALATCAWAQAPYRYGSWRGGYRHASTEAESRARGMADYVRSAGAANLMNSEAAKNYEDARRKYLDNRVYATQKYFEMRAINRQARAAEGLPKPSQQDLIRYAQSGRPDRLTSSDLDPLTGAIAWPSLLQSDDYKAEREQLDQIFAARASSGHLNAEQITRIDALTKKMQNDLKANLSKYPPQLYVASRNFIESLAYESYFTTS